MPLPNNTFLFSIKIGDVQLTLQPYNNTNNTSSNSSNYKIISSSTTTNNDSKTKNEPPPHPDDDNNNNSNSNHHLDLSLENFTGTFSISILPSSLTPDISQGEEPASVGHHRASKRKRELVDDDDDEAGKRRNSIKQDDDDEEVAGESLCLGQKSSSSSFLLSPNEQQQQQQEFSKIQEEEEEESTSNDDANGSIIEDEKVQNDDDVMISCPSQIQMSPNTSVLISKLREANNKTKFHYHNTTSNREGLVPCPRWGQSTTVIDDSSPHQQRVLLYGGQTIDTETGEFSTLADVLIYHTNENRWQKPVNCDGLARCWHSSSFLPEKKLLITFGGEALDLETGKTEVTEQVMVLDTDIMLWYPPAVSGVAPSARSGHSATLIDNHLLVVFGGVKGSNWLNSLAVLDTNRWKWSRPKVVGNPPRARSYHSATALGDNKIIIFGGNDDGTTFDCVHYLDTSGSKWAWYHPDIRGVVPKARTGHSATLLKDSKTILVYGGWDPITSSDDDGQQHGEAIMSCSFLLDTETWTWSVGPLIDESINKNYKRTGHSAVLFCEDDNSQEVLCFGGKIPGDDDGTFTSDILRFNPSSLT